MRPIEFDACLGWLHVGRSTRGVVLCEPLGHEALWTHKLMRALADRLAARGLWVLRFHYPSSGDSVGDDLAPGRFARSLASVHAAVRALRAHTGVRHVTLAGARAGASFALLAATSPEPDAPPVDAYVGLAPVVRGRAYLRELAMVQQRWLDSAPPTVRACQRDEPWLNILGHRYPADLVDALRGIDLVDATTRATTLPQTALLVDTEYGASPALRDALRAQGVPVDTQGFDEWANALQEGARSRLPLHALDAVTGWLTRDLDAPPARSTRTPRTEAPLEFKADGVVERLVRIGPARLVGMLCEPSEPSAARADVPLLLIPNTAANPRSGDGRIAVRLARALARQGIASLRIDIDGVGDSGARAPDDQSVVLYSERAIADVAAAADWLAARGCRPVVAFAVCSGAYAALHAAAQSTSLAGVIAINLPRFIWPRGMTLADALRQQTNSARGYLASVRDWRKWRRLVRERRDLRPIVGALRRLALARVRVPAARLAERFGVEPSRDTPRGLLRALARRGVRTWFVYGEYDPGVDELRRHFGAPATAFRRAPLADVRLIRELDHSVYGSTAADLVIDLCMETLTGWSRLAAGSAAPAQPAVGGERRASRPASA